MFRKVYIYYIWAMGLPFVFRTPKLSPLKFIVASHLTCMLAFKFDAQKCLYVFVYMLDMWVYVFESERKKKKNYGT